MRVYRKTICSTAQDDIAAGASTTTICRRSSVSCPMDWHAPGNSAADSFRWPGRRSRSIVEPEMHDVAVGDDILLAFQAQLAGIAGASLPVQRDIVGIGDGLGANKTFFEIGV